MAPVSRPWPLEQMRKWYEEENLSLQEIADRLSSEEWQPYWKEHWGEDYHPGQKIVNKVCKRSGFALRDRGAPLRRNGNWKGGVLVDKGGYLLIRCPGHPYATKAGYVRQHRLVMEENLGRYLEPSEVVHHIDEDPANNDLDNLVLFETQALHVSSTMSGKVPPERIVEARKARWKRRKADSSDSPQKEDGGPT